MVVLAVGLDSSILASQKSAWQSAGCCVTSAASIREAIIQFRQGNFDLILLGHSIPIESREKLAFLVRASDSQIPVVCVSEYSSGHDSFADATIQNEPEYLALAIGDLLAKRPKVAPAAVRPCESS